MELKLFPTLFFYSNSLKILAARGQVPVKDEFLQLRYNSWKTELPAGNGNMAPAQHRAG